MKELKPCPFCGSKAQLIKSGINTGCNPDLYSVQCSNIGDCGAGQVEWLYREEAIENWNRRV